MTGRLAAGFHAAHLVLVGVIGRQAGANLAANEAMAQSNDECFMRRALEVATEAGDDPSLSPNGCVIVLNGEVLAAARNHVADHQDATAHAQMEAIRAAERGRENGELRGALLYSTPQPCGMCTMASIWSKVGRVAYGAGREDVHRIYFEARALDTLSFVSKAYRDDIEIEGGVLRAECAKLYYHLNDHVPQNDQGNV